VEPLSSGNFDSMQEANGKESDPGSQKEAVDLTSKDRDKYGFLASRRRSNTASSDVCVHCRRSKLGCDANKPCRRCVQRGCADTCVSWREAKISQMASGGEQGAAGSAKRKKDFGAQIQVGGKRWMGEEQHPVSFKAGLSSSTVTWSAESLQDVFASSSSVYTRAIGHETVTAAIGAIGVPCSNDDVLLAGPSRASKRKPATLSSDVCVHCRRNKLGCEPDKPCRRCIRKGCADTCVSWREAQMASGGEQGAAVSARRHEGAIDIEDEDKKAASSPPAASWSSEDLRDASDARAAASAGPARAKVAADVKDPSVECSDDDADHFSWGLRYLKTRPLPEDF